VKKQNASLLMA